MASYAVTSALRSILEPNSNIGSELSTALVSLGSAIDQIGTKQETMEKDLELVRRMTRTNWLMVLNLPLPFGVSKGQALQLLFSKLDYTKPLFDSDRDLIASDLLHVNRNGLLCNMSFLVAQRHYDHILSAPFQRKLIDYNKGLNKEHKVTIGRVLTPNERHDYEMACSLKRLIIRKMQEKKRSDPNYQILFVLVDKKTLRLRIDKQYYSLEDASLRYGITSEEVTSELKRYGDTTKAALDKKSRTKRPGSSGNGPDNKVPRIIPLDKK